MAPDSGDEPYITWPPHPDPQVEQLFREANRAGYVIYRLQGIYRLVSPDLQGTMYFPGRVVPSSGIWRLMVKDLQDWLARTKKMNRKGRDDGGLQNLY